MNNVNITVFYFSRRTFDINCEAEKGKSRETFLLFYF